jgi:hypothetical protein
MFYDLCFLFSFLNFHAFEVKIPFESLEAMRINVLNHIRKEQEELHLYDQYCTLFALKQYIIILRNKEYLYDSDTLVRDVLKRMARATEGYLDLSKSSSPRDDLADFLQTQYNQIKKYIQTLEKIKRTRDRLLKKNNSDQLNDGKDGGNSIKIFVPALILGTTALIGFFFIRSVLKNQ